MRLTHLLQQCSMFKHSVCIKCIGTTDLSWGVCWWFSLDCSSKKKSLCFCQEQYLIHCKTAPRFAQYLGVWRAEFIVHYLWITCLNYSYLKNRAMLAHFNWEIMYLCIRSVYFPVIFRGCLCLCSFFSFPIFLNKMFYVCFKLFQYKTKREKVEATTVVDKNSSIFTEESVTSATTPEVSEVRPLLLYSIIIYEVRRKNID